MNIIKKMMLGVASFITTAGSIAGVLACGTTPAKNITITLKNGQTMSVKDKIFVGIRPEDTKTWNPIFKSFKKATGISVSPILAEMNSYGIWDKTNNLPDVTVTDSGAAVKGVLDGYFQAIDPSEVLGGDKFVIESEEVRTWGDNSYFDMPMYKSSHYVDKDGNLVVNKLAMLPTIKGPQALTIWDKVGGVDLLDGKIPLRYFINSKTSISTLKGNQYTTTTPNLVELINYSGKSRDGKSVVNFNLTYVKGSIKSGDAIDILHDPIDGHRYMNTREDIQKFINGAALNEQRRYYDASEHVFPVGRYGLLQRIISVSKTLINYVNTGAFPKIVSKNKLWDWGVGKTFRGGIMTADLGAGWGFAWEKDVFDDNDLRNPIDITKTAYNPDSTIIEEREIFTKGAPTGGDNSYKISFSQNKSERNFSKTFEKQFYAGQQMGYMQGINSKALGVGNTMDFFANQAIIGQIIPKWMVPAIFSKIEQANPNGVANIVKKEEALKDPSKYDLALFSLPIFDTGVDGMALKKNNTTPESLNASKLFLRYLVKPEIAAQVAGDKTISLVKPAIAMQQDSGELGKYYISKAGANSIFGDTAWPPSLKKNPALKTIQEASNNDYPLVMVRSVSMNLASDFVEAGYHYEPTDPSSDEYVAKEVHQKASPTFTTGANYWFSYNKVLDYLIKNSPEFLKKLEKLGLN